MQEVADKVYVSTSYEGVNVCAILTRKGFICVDAPSYPRDARDWGTRLHHIDPRPVRYVVLTNSHGDRVLNARWLNGRIIAHQLTAERLNSYDKRFPQPMLDSLIVRNPEAGRELANIPVERATVSFDLQMTLVPGGRKIELIHLPGPDAGNIGVYIPDANVLFTGDALVSGTHPWLNHAVSRQWLETLARLMAPPFDQVKLIPGRGEEATGEHIELVAAYIRTARERVRELLQSQRPRSELSSLAVEFLSRFPINQLPRDWVQAQLRAGFEHIYEELREPPRAHREILAVQQ